MYSLHLTFYCGGTATVITPWYVINKNGSISFEGVETAWVKTHSVEWVPDETPSSRL